MDTRRRVKKIIDGRSAVIERLLRMKLNHRDLRRIMPDVPTCWRRHDFHMPVPWSQPDLSRGERFSVPRLLNVQTAATFEARREYACKKLRHMLRNEDGHRKIPHEPREKFLQHGRAASGGTDYDDRWRTHRS
jgi:hypothetical protein